MVEVASEYPEKTPSAPQDGQKSSKSLLLDYGRHPNELTSTEFEGKVITKILLTTSEKTTFYSDLKAHSLSPA